MQGYFLDGLVCNACGDVIPGCLQCDNSTHCYSCDITYFLENNICTRCSYI